MLIHVDSLDDPRLGDYVGMTDVALRKKLETEHGLYVAESTKVIMRAIQAGHRPRSFLTDKRWLEQLQPWIVQATGASDGGQVPIFIADESQLMQITGFHLHRGAIAAMNRPALAPVEELLQHGRDGGLARRVMILEGLVDHTNVGAIFRSAAALNIDAVLVTPDCADPLYRRSIRVSMGTVFQVPWTRIPDLAHFLPYLRELGFISVALALKEDSVPIDEFSATSLVQGKDSRLALIMGTEGDGLRQRSIASADYNVVIPMAGHVDSLNVAAASALACWELRVRH